MSEYIRVSKAINTKMYYLQAHVCICYSDVPKFDFLEKCFICNQYCSVEPDERHPNRWLKNSAVLCRTADRGKSKDGIKRKSFKEASLIEVIVQ